MQAAATQTIVLSLAVAVLMLMGIRAGFLGSVNVSSGRELMLRSLATIVVLVGVLFTLAQSNAIDASNEQLAIALVSLGTTSLVALFNRRIAAKKSVPTYREPLWLYCQRGSDSAHRGSILKANYGNMLIRTSRIKGPRSSSSQPSSSKQQGQRLPQSSLRPKVISAGGATPQMHSVTEIKVQPEEDDDSSASSKQGIGNSVAEGPRIKTKVPQHVQKSRQEDATEPTEPERLQAVKAQKSDFRPAYHSDINAQKQRPKFTLLAKNEGQEECVHVHIGERKADGPMMVRSRSLALGRHSNLPEDKIPSVAMRHYVLLPTEEDQLPAVAKEDADVDSEEGAEKEKEIKAEVLSAALSSSDIGLAGRKKLEKMLAESASVPATILLPNATESDDIAEVDRPSFYGRFKNQTLQWKLEVILTAVFFSISFGICLYGFYSYIKNIL